MRLAAPFELTRETVLGLCLLSRSLRRIRGFFRADGVFVVDVFELISVIDGLRLGLKAFDAETTATTTQKFQQLAILRHDGEVIGFSGADGRVVDTPSGRRFYAQYQGQAMLDHRFRRTGWSALGPIALGLRGMVAAKHLPFVLWQDAVTVRTFMLVAKNAPTYYPHPHRPFPDDLRELRGVLGRWRYGDRYCPRTGVVKKDGRLVTEEDIDERRLANPHIRFYAKANPGYVDGDGLLQLTPLNTATLLRAGANTAFSVMRGRR